MGRALVVSLCIQCGYPTSGPDDLCVHHVASCADDWAMGNRIMCDFLHRGNRVAAARPARSDVDDSHPIRAGQRVGRVMVVRRAGTSAQS